MSGGYVSNVQQQQVVLTKDVIKPVVLTNGTSIYIRVGAVAVKLAYNAECVPFMSLPANAEYNRVGLTGARTLYFLATAAGTTIDLEVWT